MAKKSLGRFSISPPSGGNGIKVPAMGSKSTGIASLISMAANQQQNQETTSSMGDVMGQVTSQFPKGVPKGTNLNIGKNTSASIPLNPEFNEGERQDIATARSLEPVVKRIKEKIMGGRLKSDYGDIGRTIRQLRIDSGEPILTSGSDLQDLQSDFNALKSILPFTSGGKQLTGIEKKLVFHLLNTTGKSDENIIHDIDTAMNVVMEKEKLAVGGASALNDSSSNMNQAPADETPDPIEAIKQRFKQRNP